jgi:hypothetical protein
MIYLTIDVDNIWMYEKEFSTAILKDPEYIYSHSLPLCLELLAKYHSKATFMIIGKDLTIKACQTFCKKAIKAGHEIGNHTWTHPISFSKLSREQKKQEITKTHLQIKNVCGKAPLGFRGPGYYVDQEIISILQQLNYIYDSSILPGFGPVLMSLYATIQGKGNSHKTFGDMQYMLSKASPYVISSVYSQKLVEFPISVLPFARLPIHTTFAYSFGTLYQQLISTYLKSKPKYVLYLLHAIDFVDIYDKTHPVIPLRYTLKERLLWIENTIKTLVAINGAPLQTIEKTII